MLFLSSDYKLLPIISNCGVAMIAYTWPVDILCTPSLLVPVEIPSTLYKHGNPFFVTIPAACLWYIRSFYYPSRCALRILSNSPWDHIILAHGEVVVSSVQISLDPASPFFIHATLPSQSPGLQGLG